MPLYSLVKLTAEKIIIKYCFRHALCDIFLSEIPPAILIDCLQVCLESLDTPLNLRSVIDILTKLSECKRFQLAVAFMSQKEKIMCKQLFAILLQETMKATDENLCAIVKNLKKKYVS